MFQHIKYRAGLMVAIILIAVASVSAQSVVYDWTSDSKTPESYPTIRRRQTVTFRIKNVNKILYTYRLEITQTPRQADDFSHIAGLLRQLRGSQAEALSQDPCERARTLAENDTKAAIEAIAADEKLPIRYARLNPKVSVPLGESVAAWNSHGDAIASAETRIREYRNRCSSEIPNHPHLDRLFTDFLDTVEKLRRLVRRAIDDPDFVRDHTIDPGNDVSVTVDELFGTETIKTRTFTFPGVDVLTLSAGALFSRIPDRTYEARKAPDSELNLLTVEGNSRATPSLVALLNYSLGSIGLDHNNAGLALSAGPVLKLGNQSDASSFGFFAGVSAHLYHRFYITPGIHFGQFADFPVGFRNGSTVPENFGELTPVKRWTARFGLALSFKARDFSGLTNSSDTPSVTGDENTGSPTPEPTPSPSPSPESETTLNLSNAPLTVAANFFRVPARSPLLPAIAPSIRRTTAELQEPVLSSEGLNGSPETTTEPAPIAMPESASVGALTSASGFTRLTSITNPKLAGGRERIVFEAGTPIRDYAVSFRNGRFFLTLRRTQLEVFQDGLAGRSYTDAIFEKNGDDLVISFTLSPGTKARVKESASGLTLDFVVNAR